MLMLVDVERTSSTGNASTNTSPAIGWTQDGSTFVIRAKEQFTRDILPVFFGESKFASFTRKLYRWGFRQLGAFTKGKKNRELIFGHEYFHRDKKELIVNMKSAASIHATDSTSAGHKRARPPTLIGNLSSLREGDDDIEPQLKTGQETTQKDQATRSASKRPSREHTQHGSNRFSSQQRQSTTTTSRGEKTDCALLPTAEVAQHRECGIVGGVQPPAGDVILTHVEEQDSKGGMAGGVQSDTQLQQVHPSTMALSQLLERRGRSAEQTGSINPIFGALQSNVARLPASLPHHSVFQDNGNTRGQWVGGVGIVPTMTSFPGLIGSPLALQTSLLRRRYGSMLPHLQMQPEDLERLLFQNMVYRQQQQEFIFNYHDLPAYSTANSFLSQTNPTSNSPRNAARSDRSTTNHNQPERSQLWAPRGNTGLLDQAAQAASPDTEGENDSESDRTRATDNRISTFLRNASASKETQK